MIYPSHIRIFIIYIYNKSKANVTMEARFCVLKRKIAPAFFLTCLKKTNRNIGKTDIMICYIHGCILYTLLILFKGV